MKSREDAARFIEAQLDEKAPPIAGKQAWHYGRAELRQLLDFIYGGAPTNTADELFRKSPVVEAAPIKTPPVAAEESTADATAPEVELNFSSTPPPTCKRCGKHKGVHRAVTLECPSGRGSFPTFQSGQTYEPRRARRKKVAADE